MIEKINEAHELTKNIDFVVYVSKLEKYQTIDNLKMYGITNAPLPNIADIYRAKEIREKSNKEFLKIAENYPDKPYGLESGLSYAAKRILQSKQLINKIREGSIEVLNMQAVGSLWADCETLRNYKEVKQDVRGKSKKRTKPSQYVRAYFLHLMRINSKLPKFSTDQCNEAKTHIKQFGIDNGLILDNTILYASTNPTEITKHKNFIEIKQDAIELFKTVFKELPTKQ